MTTPQLAVPVTDDDHVLGGFDARATIVEYGDYECSFCGQAQEVLLAARRRYGADIRLVFRNYPITDSHPHALAAALAAEAAAAHGKFWQMHDALYAHQRDLSDGALANIAEQIGLSGSSVVGPATDTYLPRIQNDINSGDDSGVEGTPWIFVNGAFVEDWTEAGLFPAIEAQLIR